MARTKSKPKPAKSKGKSAKGRTAATATKNATIRASAKASESAKAGGGAGPSGKVPATFRRRSLDINGVETVVYSAGKGPPLMFLHGAGTGTGFHFLADWTKDFTIHFPFHPGFGESGDAPEIGSIRDYVLHYLTLIDRLGLDTVNLVGQSFGGWIAATLATHSSHRLRKLVLAAPAGLRNERYPSTDLFRLKPEQFAEYLAHDPNVMLRHIPAPGSDAFFDFLANNYRETTSWAEIAWERAYDPKLPGWLPRISVPTLLIYGDKDRVVPHQQSRAWSKLIPDTKTVLVKNAGHLLFDENPDAGEQVARFLA